MVDVLTWLVVDRCLAEFDELSILVRTVLEVIED